MKTEQKATSPMKTKQQIMQLLRMSQEGYAKAVERLGYAYAEYNCLNCKGAVEYLTRTSAYWKWWMRHFDIRDEIFLADYGSYTGRECLHTLRTYWIESHSPEQVEGRIPDPAWQQMLNAIREEEDALRPVYHQL
jgi:hypothetical protein